jgi:uncharacterized lipoprotein YajG
MFHEHYKKRHMRVITNIKKLAQVSKKIFPIALLLMLAACNTQTKEEEKKEKQEIESIDSHMKTDQERMDSMKKALGLDSLQQDSL